MNKKFKLLVVLLLVVSLGGCSVNKSQLIDENTQLKQKIDNQKEENEKYENIPTIFNFYNTLTNKGVNSFVVVEASESFFESRYGDGVVIASNGIYYYILADYNSLISDGRNVQYRIMDANANVYPVEIANVYDTQSGLLLLRANVSGVKNVAMESISLGDTTSLVGHISNTSHLNKIQLSNKIKTNTMSYDDVSYNSYSFEDSNLVNGALVNIDNELCGFYLSNYNAFIDSKLVKYIVNTIYQLNL